MLTQRIFSSVILVIITALSLKVGWLLALTATVLIILALLEFFNMIQKKGIYIYKSFGVFVGIVIPLSIYFKFELTKSWELLFIVILLVTLFLLQFMRRTNAEAITGVSITLFGILYISWFFSFVIKIHFLPYGTRLLSALILITKSGDIGAFLVGTRWGRHALIPRISPKKSIEGALGGLIFSILTGMSCKLFLPFSYLHLAALGYFLGLIGQFGDLSESLIKRDCQVKDSAGLLPGLGGILDLLDSLLFTAPAFYFYMSIILKR